MKAIAIDGFGGDDKLRLVELPDPKPREGEVLIRVKSAGVGIWDEMVIRGEIKPENPRFPLVPGWEGAGVIVALGPGITDFRTGDAVFYYAYPEPDNLGGAWAEEVKVPARYVARAPRRISLEEAGGLPIIGLTAYQALHEGFQLKSGQSLLILNGAGGVGTVAIQLAKLIGAKVIALASEPNHRMLKDLGADWTFDYHKDFASEIRKLFPEGIDCVFDNAGKRDTVAKAMPCLRPSGIFLSIVDEYKDLERSDVQNKYFDSHPSGEQLAEIARLVDEGKLRYVVDRVFPLEKAREALATVESGHVHGKVVLRIA